MVQYRTITNRAHSGKHANIQSEKHMRKLITQTFFLQMKFITM